MKRSELEKIIAEEFVKYLLELKSVSSKVDEAKKGQNKSGKYTSVGTVPKTFTPPRKISAAERHKIGVKLMNLYARGDVRGTGKGKGQKSTRAMSFRNAINKKVDDFVSQYASLTPGQIQQIDDPKKRAKLTMLMKAANSNRKNDRRQVVNSFIWAAASNIAAKNKTKGGTAPQTKNKSVTTASAKPEKKSKEKKGGEKKPTVRKSTKKSEEPKQSDTQE